MRGYIRKNDIRTDISPKCTLACMVTHAGNVGWTVQIEDRAEVKKELVSGNSFWGS